MKSAKRVTLVLMLCLVCVLFTGCSDPISDAIDAWNDAQDAKADKKGEEETIGLLQGIQGYKTNSGTAKAANRLANAQTAYAGAKSKLKAHESNWLTDLWDVGGLNPFSSHNKDKWATANAKARLDASKTSFKEHVATDTTLAKDKKAREQASQQKDSNPLQKVVIVAGVIVVLIILLFLFMKFKKRKPAEPKPIEEKKEHTGLLKVNYDSLLKDNCSKCNLNAAEISNMFDGNTRLASDAVQYCATKGLKGNEAMEHVKKKAKHFKDYGN